MTPTLNNRIQRGFSESAKQYDLYAKLHREIADQLFAQVIKGASPLAVLDIGCGTGYLTVKLKEYLPQSRVIGLDFSPGMLDTARPKNQDIDWVLADGMNLPFSDGNFDLVISNLAYQWAGDLTRAFTQARRVLSPEGVLACTLFSYHTCQELFQCLGEAKSESLQFSRLPDDSQVCEALINSGFEKPSIEGEQIKIEFKDMHQLMGWLKSIGANNLSREGYLGPEAMMRAASIYREKFAYRQGVAATFEVIRIYAKK